VPNIAHWRGCTVWKLLATVLSRISANRGFCYQRMLKNRINEHCVLVPRTKLWTLSARCCALLRSDAINASHSLNTSMTSLLKWYLLDHISSRRAPPQLLQILFRYPINYHDYPFPLKQRQYPAGHQQRASSLKATDAVTDRQRLALGNGARSRDPSGAYPLSLTAVQSTIAGL